MQINVTVFFQIANFLVSVYFIRRYFYEPFLDHLAKKKHLIRTLSSACVTEKEKAESLTKTSFALFAQFQQNAVSQYPQEEAAPVLIAPDQQPSPTVQKPDEAAVEELVSAFKEKIRHEFLS